MLNKRSPNSKTWMNFDGSFTTEIHQGIVHFSDDSGNLHNISTNLYDEADLFDYHGPVEENGSSILNEAKERAMSDVESGKLNRDNYDFQGLHVPFLAKIPRIFKRGYTIGEGNNSLKFIPIGSSPTKGYVDDTNTNTIHYQDAWNDTDVTLELKDNGIKETIILKTDKAPTSFSFEVQGGLEDDLSSGSMKLEPAWLEDKKGEKRDVSQTIRRVDDKTFVDLVADVTGLAFPVYVDPTVTIINDNEVNFISDNVIDLNAPDSYFGNQVSFALKDRDVIRTLIKFPQLYMPKGAEVINATLSLYVYNTVTTGTAHTTIHGITQDWDLTRATWNNQPDHSEIIKSPLKQVNTFITGYTGWDVKTILQAMADGTNIYGFKVKSSGTSDAAASVYLSGVSTPTSRPKLEFTYNEPPTKPNLITPNGGETWNSLHTVDWLPSTDNTSSVFEVLNNESASYVGTGYVYRLGQTLTVPGDNYRIFKAGIRLACEPSEAEDGHIMVTGVAIGDLPNSTIYAKVPVSVTSSMSWIEVEFPSFSVPKGTKLAVFYDNGGVSKRFYTYYNSSDLYKGGKYFYDDTTQSAHDIHVRLTYDDGTPQDQLKYQIQLSSNNGSTWKDIVPLTVAGATSHNYDFINEPESALSKIRIRAYDGSIYGEWDESDGVFTIQHNQAPVMPTNLQPSSNVVDRQSVVRFSWQHNDPNTSDPQSKFDLQWRKQGVANWNTVTQSTTNTFYDMPVNALPIGAIEWQVRTYDQEGLSSPFASIVVFNAANKPEPAQFVTPVDGAIVPVANPVVQWSHPSQIEYWVRVLDESDNTVLFEEKKVSVNKATTVKYNLANNTKYKVQVAIKDSYGLYSDFTTSNITVSYTPPALQTLTTIEDNKIGTITVHVYNPPPIGTEPTVIYNDLFRKEGNGDWIRIGTNIAADSDFVDYTAKTETVVSYYAIAYGNNSTLRKSNTVITKVKVAHTHLSLASNPSIYVQMQKRQGSQEFNSIENEKMQFAGRSYPMTEFGEKLERNFDYSYKVFSQQEMEMAKELVGYGETLLLRDNRGRKDYVTISDITIDERPILWEISISPQKVYYVEGV